MKKEIITIAGIPGSGKSSTAKEVARLLGYRHFSSGDIFRQIGTEHGWTVEETNFRAESDPQIDYEIDEKVRGLNEENKIVIDSRTAFHWIPDSFKVYLTLDQKTAAERVFNNLKEGGRIAQEANSPEEVYQKTLERYRSENKRYDSLYNLDVTDLSQYDLIIDTKIHNLSEVVTQIVEQYKNWLAA